MTNRNSFLNDHFRDKPECVIKYPSWLLNTEQMDRYRSMPGLAIVEMAGRDSVAAAVEAVKQKGFTDLVPVYVYTGTEYGPWASVETAVLRLRKRLPDIRIHELMVMGSPRFWHAMNGRLTSELIKRYGFYTPCVGCHLYLHAARIPLSRLLEAPIIAGERERHDGAVKVNQTATALEGYLALARIFKTQLLFPLRDIDDGREIERILGLRWKQDEEQLACVFSGNYRLAEKRIAVNEAKIAVYLEEFAIPLAQAVVQSYLQKKVPDHHKLACRIIQNLGSSPAVSVL